MPRSSVTLEQRLEDFSKQNELPANPGQFLPHHGRINYYANYTTFANYLKNNIHKDVTQVAMLKDGGYLTNHGPEHITTVIQRASDLLDIEHANVLEAYEIFLLLCAIQIHDAGHVIGGRQHHEQNGKELLVNLTADRIEKIFIADIAKVHGGVLNDGNKDTITSIDIEAPYHAFNIRLQFLAAVLRFADELSDDESRASRYLLQNGGLPESSEIYHAYAEALKSVNIIGKEVRLNFVIESSSATKTYGKGTGEKDVQGNIISKQVYLLDEILARTFKMYCECVYCMRFFPLPIQIKTIRVTITIYDGFRKVGKPITYPLTESGYPLFPGDSALTMCKDDLTIEGKPLDGAYLKEIVEQALTPSSAS